MRSHTNFLIPVNFFCYLELIYIINFLISTPLKDQFFFQIKHSVKVKSKFCNSFSLYDRDKRQDGCSDVVFENFKAGTGFGNYPLKTSRQKQQRIHRASCHLGGPEGVQM